jgi:hypothetical protein
MLSQESIEELRSAWLPNITEAGLHRLIDLLEKASPLLIHGSFSRALPMGCLATHIAWNHPKTAHLTQEAGLSWLYQVAGLNPATSRVIREWDIHGIHDLELRNQLLALFHEECQRRHRGDRQPSTIGYQSCVDCSLPAPERPSSLKTAFPSHPFAD